VKLTAIYIRVCSRVNHDLWTEGEDYLLHLSEVGDVDLGQIQKQKLLIPQRNLQSPAQLAGASGDRNAHSVSPTSD
jgi:hypothetical protein